MRTISRTLAAVLLGGLAVACGVNPVTGERELQLISQTEEIQIGQQQYVPSQQMQGGDYTAHPGVALYVSEVGQRLASVADRPLPYEFAVLNNSVPNAWALPGGKIAVNRGLLMELDSEAELAAVLGHEIVHAAARHGAKGVERGMLLQGAVLALALSARDNQYAGMIVGGATLGATLITQKYGRDAELEADRYGTLYMARSGYNPYAAVTLQETFVELSEGRDTSWLEGLFASHPPSTERVAANRATAAELGTQGEIGQERYRERLAPLFAAAEAYTLYDEGVKALGAGEADRAYQLASEALTIEPAEAKFYELRGDADLKRQRYAAALAQYQQAIVRNPGYFKPYLQSGLARYESGDAEGAEADLNKSLELLPTATAHYTLGRIAEKRGDRRSAAEHYRVAASSNSDVGRASLVAFTRLDLPSNPSQYLRAEARVDNQGRVFALIENRAALAVDNVRLKAVLLDATGHVIQEAAPVIARTVIQPGETTLVATGVGGVTTTDMLRAVRIQILGASVAEGSDPKN